MVVDLEPTRRREAKRLPLTVVESDLGLIIERLLLLHVVSLLGAVVMIVH